jgi:hypothetical protein
MFIAMANSYSDKLKDPRWQKKRLEIFNRDDWTCRICGDDKDTLSVHHKRYFPKTDPWDYDSEYLITVCEKCHQLIEHSKFLIENFDISKMRAHCISYDENALLIYRYENLQPILVFKRGSLVAPTMEDAQKLIEILKDI